MTLGEFRLQPVEKLKHCRDSERARSLLSEFDLVLSNSRISDQTKRTFWDAVMDDLDAMGQDSTRLLDEHAAAALNAVVAAAQSVICEYRLLVGTDELGCG